MKKTRAPVLVSSIGAKTPGRATRVKKQSGIGPEAKDAYKFISRKQDRGYPWAPNNGARLRNKVLSEVSSFVKNPRGYAIHLVDTCRQIRKGGYRRLSALKERKAIVEHTRKSFHELKRYGFKRIMDSRLFRFQKFLMREVRLGGLAKKVDEFVTSRALPKGQLRVLK